MKLCRGQVTGGKIGAGGHEKGEEDDEKSDG